MSGGVLAPFLGGLPLCLDLDGLQFVARFRFDHQKFGRGLRDEVGTYC